MANPIRHGLSGLARFSGRDTRGQFWPYAALVVALLFLILFVGMSMVIGSMVEEMQRFAAEHPEAATVHAGPGSYSIQIEAGHPDAPVPDFGAFIAVLALGVVAAVALLAAAVSRRLHDSGGSALWGMLPLPFLTFGLAALPIVTRQLAAVPEPDLGLFFLMFFNNMAYIAALGTLVVMLCLRGTQGPNRFGPVPAAQGASPTS